MKRFLFDTILDPENICNMNREAELLRQAVQHKKKVVVYGPRNYGKTSLIQSLIIPEFRRAHKNSFVLQADLMETRTPEALNQRICRAFEHSFAAAFPRRQLLESAKRLLLGFRPTVEFDELTGQPSISIGFNAHTSTNDWQKIFRTINDEIAPHHPTLIVLDEFQDVSFVDGGTGLMRQSLQTLRDIPIIILGSKQQMLADIFAAPRAPLAQFGEDISFNPIPYDEYSAYINERFASARLVLESSESIRLQDSLHRVPEAINIVCAKILELYADGVVTWEKIATALVAVIDNRQSRYETFLSLLSPSEVKFLVALQKFNRLRGPLQKPNGIEFMRTVSLSARTIRLNVNGLLSRGVVEKIPSGLRVADPLLGLFLGRYH